MLNKNKSRGLAIILALTLVLGGLGLPVLASLSENNRGEYREEPEINLTNERKEGFSEEERGILTQTLGESPGALRLDYFGEIGPDEIVEIAVQFVTPPAVALRLQHHDQSNILRRVSEAVFEEQALEGHRKFLEQLEILEQLQPFTRAGLSQIEIFSEHYNLFNGVFMRVPRHMVDEIAALEEVFAVTPNRRVSVGLPVFNEGDFGTKDFMRESLELFDMDFIHHEMGFTGEGISVAVLDTGVDYTHPRLERYVDPETGRVRGWSTIYDSYDVMDFHGHGTHVSGTVIGIAPEVELWHFQVLDSGGWGTDESVLGGVEAAHRERVDVMNLSLGAENDNIFCPMNMATNLAMLDGIVVVNAAGNAGEWGLSSPGMASLPISVGSGTLGGRNDLGDSVSWFSSLGPVVGTYHIKPDILAPGEGIVSTCLEGGYLLDSGTSMAAPHVAGFAALMLERFPDANTYEIKARMMNTARPLADSDNRVFHIGAGFIQPIKALDTEAFATVRHDVPWVEGESRTRREETMASMSFGLVIAQPVSEPMTVTIHNSGDEPWIHEVFFNRGSVGAELNLIDSSENGLDSTYTFQLEFGGSEGRHLYEGVVIFSNGSQSISVPFGAMYDCTRRPDLFLIPNRDLDFGRLLVGYERVRAYAVRMISVGNVPTGRINIELVGDHPEAFILEETTIPSLEIFDQGVFAINPQIGLEPGVYEAGVVISLEEYDGYWQFNLRFQVDAYPDVEIELWTREYMWGEEGPGLQSLWRASEWSFGSRGNYGKWQWYRDEIMTLREVWVKNTGNSPTDELRVTLQGLDLEAFVFFEWVYVDTWDPPYPPWDPPYPPWDPPYPPWDSPDPPWDSPYDRPHMPSSPPEPPGGGWYRWEEIDGTEISIPEIYPGEYGVFAVGTRGYLGINTATVAVAGEGLITQYFDIRDVSEPVEDGAGVEMELHVDSVLDLGIIPYGFEVDRTVRILATNTGSHPLNPGYVIQEVSGDLENYVWLSQRWHSWLPSTIMPGDTAMFFEIELFNTSNFPLGIHYTRVRLKNWHDENVIESFYIRVEVKDFSQENITIDPGGDLDFGSAAVGYIYGGWWDYCDFIQIVRVLNTGGQEVWEDDLHIRLEGEDAHAFNLVVIRGWYLFYAKEFIIDNHELNDFGSYFFGIRPEEGLAPGTYQGAVVISGRNGVEKSFGLSFEVEEYHYGIGLFPMESHDFGQREEDEVLPPHWVQIRNTGNVSTGELEISISGENPDSFRLSRTSMSNLQIEWRRYFRAEPDETSAFLVVTPKAGLAEGLHTATITVSGENVVSQSFDVYIMVGEVCEKCEEHPCICPVLCEECEEYPCVCPYGVNRVPLRETILLAEGRVQANYTLTSWITFGVALEAARVVYRDENATQAQIDGARQELITAMNGLVRLPVPPVPCEVCEEYPCACPDKCEDCEEYPCACPDKCEDCEEYPCVCPDKCEDCEEYPCVCPYGVNRVLLRETILLAEGRVQANYTLTSWITFGAALEAARVVYRDENATQAQIDGARQGLITAMNGLVRLPVPPVPCEVCEEYPCACPDKCEDCEEYPCACPDKCEDCEEYPCACPDKCEDCEEYPCVCPDKCEECEEYPCTCPVAVNRGPLREAIAQGAARVEGNYTPASWTIFVATLEAAREVYGNIHATQIQIDGARQTLVTAMDGLVLRTVINRAPLRETIGLAEARVQANYTQGSWTSFAAALEAARVVYGDGGATQAQIDSARQALINAMNGLVPVTTGAPPKTGDTANMNLWIFLTTLGMFGLVATGFMLKKDERRRVNELKRDIAQKMGVDF